MKLHEEFKLYEKLWEEFNEAADVGSKFVKDLYTVDFGGQTMFTGTRKECEDYIEKHPDPKGKASGRMVIKRGANVPVVEQHKKLKEAPAVASKHSSDVWTLAFKDDPGHPIIQGDKAKCDAFYKNLVDSPAAKHHGGLVIKQGGVISVLADENLTEATATKTIRCANAQYEDDDGCVCNVGIYAGDASFEELVEILYDQGMMYVDVYDEYECKVTTPTNYKLGDVVDVFDVDDEVITAFAEEHGLDPEDYLQSPSRSRYFNI